MRNFSFPFMTTSVKFIVYFWSTKSFSIFLPETFQIYPPIFHYFIILLSPKKIDSLIQFIPNINWLEWE